MSVECVLGAYYGPERIDKKEVIDAVKKVLRDIDGTCVLHYIVKPDHLIKGSYGIEIITYIS